MKTTKATEPVYTPTQLRILEVLSDGEPHDPYELFTRCIDDELASKTNLQMHISILRKKLREVGQDIVCEYRRRTTFYRHVVHLRVLSLAQD